MSPFETINMVLSGIILIIVVLATVILSFNLFLLQQYRKRRFFKTRCINLLILTIIPSAIEVFVLVPISTLLLQFFEYNDEFYTNFRLLLHTTCMDIWILTIFTRLWYVFVQIRKQQDSLDWKKVMSHVTCHSVFLFNSATHSYRNYYFFGLIVL